MNSRSKTLHSQEQMEAASIIFSSQELQAAHIFLWTAVSLPFIEGHLLLVEKLKPFSGALE